MKELRCRELGFDCDGKIQADSEDEVLRQVAAHAQSTHNMTVTPELAADARSKIRDVGSTSA